MGIVYKYGLNDMPHGWGKENETNWRIYTLWQNMLKRCYDEKYINKNQTYKDCYVCDKWLKLSGFIEDLPKIDGYELWLNNPNKHISLDKDIKSNNKNKCYCLKECIFVTKKQNSSQSLKNTHKNKKINTSKANNPRAKKVKQSDLNGNLIKIWNYAKEISDAYNWNYNTFLCHLNNNKYSNEYKGFIWEYLNEGDTNE